MQNNNLKFKIFSTLRCCFSLFAFRFKFNSGFSLIELLVTISIFVIVTVIVFVNFPSFSSRISLENLAHEVALAVRQAQVFGISSREFGAGSGIFPSHGAHFSSIENTKFFLYVDTNNNKKYDGVLEEVEKYTIRRQNYVSQICGFTTSASSCTLLDTVDITFTRPNPEPTILGRVGVSESNYSYTTMTIASPSGATQVVTIWSNGQISIQ